MRKLQVSLKRISSNEWTDDSLGIVVVMHRSETETKFAALYNGGQARVFCTLAETTEFLAGLSHVEVIRGDVPGTLSCLINGEPSLHNITEEDLARWTAAAAMHIAKVTRAE